MAAATFPAGVITPIAADWQRLLSERRAYHPESAVRPRRCETALASSADHCAGCAVLPGPHDMIAKAPKRTYPYPAEATVCAPGHSDPVRTTGMAISPVRPRLAGNQLGNPGFDDPQDRDGPPAGDPSRVDAGARHPSVPRTPGRRSLPRRGIPLARASG